MYRKICSAYVENLARKLQDKGLKVTAHSLLGKPAEQIVDYAHGNHIDLILMASHGRSGISRWAYGSVTEKVLRSTRIPILIIRSPGCAPGV